MGTILLFLTQRVMLAQPSDSSPVLRGDPQYACRARCQVHETAMIADFTVVKQPDQQGQPLLGKGWVDERFPPL
jgi:hypothetical protein